RIGLLHRILALAGRSEIPLPAAAGISSICQIGRLASGSAVKPIPRNSPSWASCGQFSGDRPELTFAPSSSHHTSLRVASILSSVPAHDKAVKNCYSEKVLRHLAI